ncbi:cytochrome c biogenesis protein CcdA [Corynebacterium timonense]|uniref:Cytochrome c biogenesis protein CcdA n=1 Tax=Corynebacterium timonense TaxID=441500 RepID=A0A1H1SVU0_9CORY|nr:cytochrome c biogenesis protein CcdA [Corynebacterium timonense]SDS51836.1 Cytochrome c biogenesis protein CcdA [Corynebacterium timonense]
MLGIAVVGFIGGVITGLSPCILPVLPVVLSVSVGRRPALVIAGMVLSFASIALLGTLLLGILGLPQSVLHWAGILMLALVGVGMIVPQAGEWIQKPFDALPRPTILQDKARGRGGFLIGLALGAVYVPCAGPILAAVTVAGSTGEIGWNTVVLTLAFAAGSAVPLFFFALAGSAIGDRVDLVQRHRRAIGVVILVFTLALALRAPAAIQRALPDWTAGLARSFNDSSAVDEALSKVRPSGGTLDECRGLDAGQLHDCGPVPEFAGLENWINTSDPVTPAAAPVTLVDFWAYACINCQRAGEHITALYDAYRDAGLQVVGVHSPEYGFEHDLNNLRSAVQREGIRYPVAQDNNFDTWRAYNNRYWPARYLVDAAGNVRSIVEGEGSYAETEQLIRQLLVQANPDVELPAPVEGDAAPIGTEGRNRETYLGTDRARFADNAGYTPGEHDFGAQAAPGAGRYALSGRWELGPESIRSLGGHMEVNVYAAWVQLVVSGSGDVTVDYPNGTQKTMSVTDGTLDLYKAADPMSGILRIHASEGVSMYSLTFG